MYSPPLLKAIPWCHACKQYAVATRTMYGERCTCMGCGRWSWDRKRLETAAVHQARQAAHAAFDVLWSEQKRSRLTMMQRKALPPLLLRRQAYKRLAIELGIDGPSCHMAQMDFETASRVPAAVERIKAALLAEQRVTA